jgi:hypothetical protein
MIYQIKIENNSKQILRYLEILGYTWQSGDKPTEWSPSVYHNCFTVWSEHMMIGHSMEDVTMSFEEFKRQNPIQQKHLRSGMIVEYVSGERRLVTDLMGRLVLISEDGFQPLSDYNEDLIIDACPYTTINKVGVSEPYCLEVMLTRATIIWERPKEVELTMEEIAEKFNISVEQLRIKK